MLSETRVGDVIAAMSRLPSYIYKMAPTMKKWLVKNTDGVNDLYEDLQNHIKSTDQPYAYKKKQRVLLVHILTFYACLSQKEHEQRDRTKTSPPKKRALTRGKSQSKRRSETGRDQDQRPSPRKTPVDQSDVDHTDSESERHSTGGSEIEESGF